VVAKIVSVHSAYVPGGAAPASVENPNTATIPAAATTQ
jgi:hypothetical protein